MDAAGELRLGSARGADLPRIAALSRAVIEAGLEPAWTVQRLDRSRRDRETMLLVAHVRPAQHGAVPAEFAGFGIMHFGDSRAHLNLLGVEPRFQRRGVGRRLLRWLEHSALVAGTFEVRLELRAGNHAAHAFYAALGYSPAGRVAGYYQGNEDAIRMRRDVRVPPPG